MILAENIQFPASGTNITATGGAGGSGAGDGGSDGGAGGAGANGRVYLLYTSTITPADAANRASPAAVVINLSGRPFYLG